MKFGTRKRNREFFTLPEVLVVLVILLVLALVAVPIIRKTRVNAWLASCMHNLRTLATASGHYQIDYRQYPPQPFQNANRLPATMAEYIENREAFACPLDETPPEDVGIIDSYSDFYVTRTSLADGDSLIAGCPRHVNQTIAVNVFKKGNATRNQLGQLHHSQGENLDRIYSGDIVGTGTTWFPDGSSMTIQTPGLEAEIVESFRLDSGQTYTLIKVPANDAFGSLILDVIPGSKFEVITPAAIAGVRGTVFMVDIIADKKGRKAADVFVFEGSVVVTESTGKGERLASWGVPIRCEQKKRPFRSPKPPPALPGLTTRPGEQPVIQRGNPPWAMGPSPWPDGSAPWARVSDGEENVEINNGDREDNGDLANDTSGGANDTNGATDGGNGNGRDHESGNDPDSGESDNGGRDNEHAEHRGREHAEHDDHDADHSEGQSEHRRAEHGEGHAEHREGHAEHRAEHHADAEHSDHEHSGANNSDESDSGSGGDNDNSGESTDNVGESTDNDADDGTLTDDRIVDEIKRGAYQGFFPRAWVKWGLWGLILQFVRLIFGF
jgi:prepilin-type N-terminal cleavage/methylation domain-containing protein